jgi:hypothetical protein
MIYPGESDWEFRPPQRSRVFSVDVPDLPGVRSSLSVGFDRLATSNDEVDLAVGLLECIIGVAPLGGGGGVRSFQLLSCRLWSSRRRRSLRLSS